MMTESDLDSKFSYLVSLRVGESNAQELSNLIKNLNVSTSINSMMSKLEHLELDINDV